MTETGSTGGVYCSFQEINEFVIKGVDHEVAEGR